jgi:hypothetical protein
VIWCRLEMLHFDIYIDDDANEMTVVQIHPDEDSLLLHLNRQPGTRRAAASGPRSASQ